MNKLINVNKFIFIMTTIVGFVTHDCDGIPEISDLCSKLIEISLLVKNNFFTFMDGDDEYSVYTYVINHESKSLMGCLGTLICDDYNQMSEYKECYVLPEEEYKKYADKKPFTFDSLPASFVKCLLDVDNVDKLYDLIENYSNKAVTRNDTKKIT